MVRRPPNNVRWGIVFNVPAAYESKLWDLPPPSKKRRLSRFGGKEAVEYSYIFEYAPQSWKEWQRVAGMKIQLEHRINKICFIDYEAVVAEGAIYTISELGKAFQTFVKFPAPQFPSSKGESYKMLCRHAKRLHYENKLHIEQLVATSIRFNSIKENDEGPTQTFKRAKAAYEFALTHKDEWKTKLDSEDLKKAHQLGASKTNNKKQGIAKENKLKAIELKKDGNSVNTISKLLNVHRSTVSRYLK